VAILLYYDGKACIVHALRMLLQARAGRTWALPGLSTDVIAAVTSFTDLLINDGLIEKLIGLFVSFSLVFSNSLLLHNFLAAYRFSRLGLRCTLTQ